MSKENKQTRLAFGIYFFIACFFVALRALSAFGLFDFMGEYANYIFTIVIQIVFLFGGSVFLFSILSKQKIKKTLSDYKVNRISTRSVIIALLVGTVVFFLNVFISSFFNEIISLFGYTSSSSSVSIDFYPVWLLLVNLVFTALLPGICEEIAHRGMILNASSKFGYFKAIIISSVMFGLLHLNIEQVFYATLIGVFLGFITTFTSSIIPAMIVHFMNNALSVFLTFSNVRGLGFSRIFTKIFQFFEISSMLGFLFVVMLVLIMAYILWGLSKLLIVSCLQDRAVEGREKIEKYLKRQMFFSGTEQKDNVVELSQEDIQKIFLRIKKEKMDGVTKVFLVSTILMTLTLTIFTFIWGVL